MSLLPGQNTVLVLPSHQNPKRGHRDHDTAVKLDKRQRLCWDRLSEQQQLTMMLPHLTARTQSQDAVVDLGFRGLGFRGLELTGLGV